MAKYESTSNGVRYDWWIDGPQGAKFELYREPHHSDADIESAKKELRRDHDVVSIRIKSKTF